MSPFPNRPCLDCGRLCHATRCDACQRAAYTRRNRNRDQFPRKVYGSAEWQRLRKEVVDDAVVCHWCGATNEKLTADHIRPVSQYRELAYDRENLVAACRSCQTKRSWESGARGYQR